MRCPDGAPGGLVLAMGFAPIEEVVIMPSKTPGGQTLFAISFASQMTNHDSALLAGSLGMSTDLHPTTGPRHDTPGVIRLDHQSGLFLKRGEMEGAWTLEARTWGQPPPQSVHQWRVLAAVAAHQLDPNVTPPDRVAVISAEIPDLLVGRAVNKRFAPFRRRLAGRM
jgi:hypothetical protein